VRLRITPKNPILVYAILNFVIILIINQISDLPVWIGNWEAKATKLASFQNPLDNFYPPGGAILLVPFLGVKPNYEIVVYFYYTASSILYYLICKSLIFDKKYLLVALLGFSLNPYLPWLVNSSQDTVFELFLVMSGFALIVSKKYFLSLLPLYLLCLTRPAYWPGFLVIPLVIKFLKIKSRDHKLATKRLVIAPFLFLFMTMSINQAVFKDPALAGEAGMTAHFSHNKYWYLSMPKFDPDVFLTTGGNMDAEKLLRENPIFANIENEGFRAALINISENPKSLFLNTLQKLDTYFFAVQKNPQLSGEYYISADGKNIVVGKERESWLLVLGSFLFFFFRSALLVLAISAVTLLMVFPKIRQDLIGKPIILFCIPYLFGSIAGVLFYSETRFKLVSEILLIPLIMKIYDKHKELKLPKLS
jgi:hypothetical protein